MHFYFVGDIWRRGVILRSWPKTEIINFVQVIILFIKSNKIAPFPGPYSSKINQQIFIT
jgi:hypothetical protein